MGTYLFVVEHGNDIISAAAVDKNHLDNDGGSRGDDLAAQHLATNGSHDALNVCSSGTWSKVASNDTVRTGCTSDAELVGLCGRVEAVLKAQDGLWCHGLCLGFRLLQRLGGGSIVCLRVAVGAS